MILIDHQRELPRLSRYPWAYLVAPALTLFIGLLVAGVVGQQVGFSGPFTLITVSSYAGLLAAPGYVAAVLADPRWLHGSAGRRLWVRASLIAGLVCGAVGAIGGTLLVLFVPPALASAVACGLLLRRFERVGRTLGGS